MLRQLIALHPNQPLIRHVPFQLSMLYRCLQLIIPFQEKYPTPFLIQQTGLQLLHKIRIAQHVLIHQLEYHTVNEKLFLILIMII